MRLIIPNFLIPATQTIGRYLQQSALTIDNALEKVDQAMVTSINALLPERYATITQTALRALPFFVANTFCSHKISAFCIVGYVAVKQIAFPGISRDLSHLQTGCSFSSLIQGGKNLTIGTATKTYRTLLFGTAQISFGIFGLYTAKKNAQSAFSPQDKYLASQLKQIFQDEKIEFTTKNSVKVLNYFLVKNMIWPALQGLPIDSSLPPLADKTIQNITQSKRHPISPETIMTINSLLQTSKTFHKSMYCLDSEPPLLLQAAEIAAGFETLESRYSSIFQYMSMTAS